MPTFDVPVQRRVRVYHIGSGPLPSTGLGIVDTGQAGYNTSC